MLFQERVVRTKFDIYIIITDIIRVLCCFILMVYVSSLLLQILSEFYSCRFILMVYVSSLLLQILSEFYSCRFILMVYVSCYYYRYYQSSIAVASLQYMFLHYYRYYQSSIAASFLWYMFLHYRYYQSSLASLCICFFIIITDIIRVL